MDKESQQALHHVIGGLVLLFVIAVVGLIF
jgi:hypothetical protein